MKTKVSFVSINYYTYSLVGITQHWHSPTPAGIPVVWRQDTFVSINYYTYSLVGITHHWHSPTPAGIPVVWRQDTFVSFYYTYSLVGITQHWHSPTPAGIPVVWRQETFVSFYYTYSLVGITQHWHSPTPAGIPVVWRQDTFVSLLLHILSGGHHSTLTQSYTSRNPCRLETGHLCFINYYTYSLVGITQWCPPESMCTVNETKVSCHQTTGILLV